MSGISIIVPHWHFVDFNFLTSCSISIDPDASDFVWNWLNSVSNWERLTEEDLSNFKKINTLTELDGEDKEVSTWRLYGAWPAETKWNEMDYGADNFSNIEVLIRYDRAGRE